MLLILKLANTSLTSASKIDLLGDKIVLLASHQQQHMENADQVIVLYKGRVLDKGCFTELHEKGVINSTVDPLYKAALKDRKDLSGYLCLGEYKETP